MINSYSQLEAHLLKILADCLNEVSKKVEDLLKEHVQEDVYDVGSRIPNGDKQGRQYYYNGTKKPTGQLKESVTSTEVQIVGNEVTTKIHHDPNAMEYDAPTYLHGSSFYDPGDVREMLPYLINEGKTGDLFGEVWHKLRRPYMTNTYNELISQDLVRKWMIIALKSRGLNVKIN